MAKRVTKGNLWGLIQSRPYASVSDIRRMFLVETDSAVPFSTTEGTYYIGLPREVADVVSQLWHEGRIVLDVNPDVKGQVIQGLFPARVSPGRQSTGLGGPNGPSGFPGGQRANPTPSRAAWSAGDTTAGVVTEPPRSGTRRRRRKRRSTSRSADSGSTPGR